MSLKSLMKAFIEIRDLNSRLVCYMYSGTSISAVEYC